MKAKKKPGMILAVSAGIFVIALSISSCFLMQIIARMNRSANESLLTSSRVISEALDSKITLDRELLFTLADLLAPEQESGIVQTLRRYADATDFFRFSYANMAGVGVDCDGNTIHTADFAFDEIALSEGADGLSVPYHGPSGRLQITYQCPIIEDGKQVGAVYADRIINDYNLPTLFTFHNGAGSAYVVDRGGGFIIKSRGTASETNVYRYLEAQGNGKAVQDTLRRVMQEGKSGTLAVVDKDKQSLLGFLPLNSPEGCYLITVIPRAVLQQEATPIIIMLCIMFGLLLVGGISVAALVAGRQLMKADVEQKAYREKLFANLSANIDFAFLLYTPAKRKVELASDNLPGLLGVTLRQVQERPELVFEASGIARGNAAREGFLHGTLPGQTAMESLTGTGPNEVKRWIAVHLIPADYGQYLAVFHETTAEHDMREQLADALAQAQNSNRARTAFFSSMSHDIRTPMNGIVGMTNIALKNLDNREKVESCLLKITAASGHLLELINEVLDMSRIESGRISLKEETVHLPSLMENLLSVIKPDMDKKRQGLRMKSQILEHDTVVGDGLHLQKILLNLLSNAVKYTQEGGEIALQIAETPLSAEQIRLRFSVKDNGIGMSPAFLERVFKPFERADDSRISRIAGTGLGLAITKNIVDMMGGTISVESREREGSCFTVEIPLKLPAQQAHAAPALSGYAALVVDDDRDAGESIALILQEIGMRAQCVLSGSEAVESAWNAHQRQDGYFVVIMDRQMPGMDGLEAARRIKARLGGEAPLLLLCASDWDGVKEEARRAGISGFLTKPIFKSDLLNQLDELLLGGEGRAREPAPEGLENLEGVGILAVDDNELNLEIIVELLKNSGASVDSARNGKEAVDRYLSSSPGEYQIILMDVHMPEMNGLEATQAIRRADRPDAAAVSVVAMTADVFKEDIRRCMDAGMDAHIGKPLELDKLYRTLQGLLQQKKKTGETE